MKRGNVNDYGSTSLLMSTSGNDFFQTIAPLFFFFKLCASLIFLKFQLFRKFISNLAPNQDIDTFPPCVD